MKQWVKFEVNHKITYINSSHIVNILYNKNTLCLYIYLMNNETIEITNFKEYDLISLSNSIGLDL